MVPAKSVRKRLKTSTIWWTKPQKPISFPMHHRTMIRITINCCTFTHRAQPVCRKPPLLHIHDTYSLRAPFIIWPISNRTTSFTHRCHCITRPAVWWASVKRFCSVQRLWFARNSPHLDTFPIVKNTNARLAHFVSVFFIPSFRSSFFPLQIRIWWIVVFFLLTRKSFALRCKLLLFIFCSGGPVYWRNVPLYFSNTTQFGRYKSQFACYLWKRFTATNLAAVC